MTKPGESRLLLVVLVSGAAVMFSTVALVIALVSAAAPPVSKYLSAQQNAEVAARMNWQWMLPLGTLALALWASVQVALHRPLLISTGTFARYPASRSSVYLSSFLVVLCGFFGARSVYFAIESMRAAAPAPITDSLTFPGLSISFGVFATVLTLLSFLLFQLWWQESRLPQATRVWSDSPAPVGEA